MTSAGLIARPEPENASSLDTAHKGGAVLTHMLPPVLRSPQSGGPMIERARCEIAGIVYEAESRCGAVLELCRVLVAAGVPDQPWQALRDGRPVLRGASIHRAALRTVSDTDRQGPRFARWRPFGGESKMDEAGAE